MLRPIFDYCSTSLGNRRALWSRDEGRCSVPDSAGPGLTSGALIDSDVAADRTWARVDLGAVVGNYESIRRAIGPGAPVPTGWPSISTTGTAAPSIAASRSGRER